MAELSGPPPRHGSSIFSPQFSLGASDMANATTIVLCSVAVWHICWKGKAQRRGLFSLQLLALLTVTWINSLLHFFGYLPSIVTRITTYDLMHNSLYIMHFFNITTLILEAQIALSFMFFSHGSTRHVCVFRLSIPMAFVVSAVIGHIFWYYAPYHASTPSLAHPLVIYEVAYALFPLIFTVSFTCGMIRLRGMPAAAWNRKRAMSYAGVFFLTVVIWDVLELLRWWTDLNSKFFWSVSECSFWLWSLNGACNAVVYIYWIRRTQLVRQLLEIDSSLSSPSEESMLAPDGYFIVYDTDSAIPVRSVVEAPSLLVSLPSATSNLRGPPGRPSDEN